MKKQKPEVMVIGGGIGGLCLAQGLQKSGVNVSVFERDASGAARPQGFRVHISPIGSRALQECLPPKLFDVFAGTCGHFGQGFSMMTEQFGEILSLANIDRNDQPNPDLIHRSVSRLTLRRILLAWLERVHFGKRLMHYADTSDGKVEAYFEDGTSAVGDVLVGADGVNSAVRKQYLPLAEPFDTGVRAVGAQIPLSDGVMSLLPAQILTGPVMIMPKEPCSLFLAIWKRSEEDAKRLEELPPLESDAEVEPEENYVIFGFGAHRDQPDIVGDLTDASPAELHNFLRKRVFGWHPNLRKLVELIDTTTLGATRLRSSKPVAPWPSTRVTVLGDAIHSMTPYRGIGANVALRDAWLLCSKLAAVARGEKDLLAGIQEYEVEMRLYAFEAVKASLEMMNRSVGEKNLAFGMMKAALKVVNSMPPLKQKMMQRMSES